MFTGIIEEQGVIKSCNLSLNGMEIAVLCEKILKDINIGASISINGACQTVVEFGENYFKVQVSNETLRVTNFKSLKAGDKVNLERALTLNKHIDGHIVSGHIDCTAEFTDKKDDGFSKRFFFKIPKEFTKYFIYKGSVAINGVSLTIASVNDTVISVELIPETLKNVNLSNLKKGDFVNIETDILAKYVEKIFTSKDNNSKVNYNFLAENGFI